MELVADVFGAVFDFVSDVLGLAFDAAVVVMFLVMLVVGASDQSPKGGKNTEKQSHRGWYTCGERAMQPAGWERRREMWGDNNVWAFRGTDRF